MNINLGNTTLVEMFGWLKQSHELIMRKPFSFMMGLTLSIIPSVVLMAISGYLFNLIDSQGIIFISIIKGVIITFLSILIICLSPVGIIMSMIAEKVDNNHSIDWKVEFLSILLTSFSSYFERSVNTAKILTSCIVVLTIFLFSMVGIIYLLFMLFDAGSLSSSSGIPFEAQLGLKNFPPLPEPIYWLNQLMTYSQIFFMNLLLISTFCPYFYSFLIYKGVLDVKFSQEYLIRSFPTVKPIWTLPYVILVFVNLLLLNFPNWHISGLINVAGGLIAATYFWVFGYVVARDKFLGIKKNKEQESSVGQGKAISTKV